MISNETLMLALGASGLGMLFGPELVKLLVSVFKGKQPSTGAFDVVAVLASVIELRKHLADDPKAIEAIDTVITPSVIRKEGVRSNES